jgi:putative heme-binding domain-containing protein
MQLPGLLFSLLLAADTGQDLEAGKAVYRSNCGFCHGLTGRGGRGPNLTSSQYQHGSSDADVRSVIRDGVPGTTMPAFELMEPDELGKLILYLRHMARGGSAGSGAKPAGDPAKGKLVYQRNGCAGCHRIGLEGGLYGPELTRAGAGRSIEYIRESIVDPTADIPQEFEGVTAILRDGARLTGLRVNEDTFTLQMREPSGGFRLYVKAELGGVEYGTKSLMPAYAQLPREDLDNLLAFLDSLRGGLRPGADARKAEGIR